MTLYARHSNSRSRSTNTKGPRGSDGKRCYAIGDVHGRLDLLKKMFDLIDQHNAGRQPRETTIVLLGDLIDRGPDSKGVVECVRTFPSSFGRLFLIAGNHEELLLRTLEGDPSAFETWIRNGGDATAASYGVQLAGLKDLKRKDILLELRRAIPANHVAVLKASMDSIRFGDYLLTHAGIRPNIALAKQTGSDLRWIEKPFLDSEADHGFVVVHGHSVKMEIEDKGNRVGIDTGAYRSGILTAIWIDGAERGFLQAVGSPATE